MHAHGQARRRPRRCSCALTTPQFCDGPALYDFFGALLDAGADRTVLHQCDPLTGMTFLFRIAIMRDWTLLQRLIAIGLDVNARNQAGRTAFFLVTTSSEAVRIFVEAGADANAQDYEGQTVLHQLALEDSPYASECIPILRSAGIDPSIRRNDGLTAVDLARQSNQAAFCAAFACVKLR